MDKLKYDKIVDNVKIYPIPGWENVYSISECGKIWSHERTVQRSHGRSLPVKGKWKKFWVNSWGYLCADLSNQNFILKNTVHALMADTFLEKGDGDLVDHVDRDKLNNNISNLRLANKSTNGCNKGRQLNNTSGYVGVVFSKQTGKWLARVKKQYKVFHVGSFSTPEEAAKARDKKAKELHGEFANLNFPEE